MVIPQAQGPLRHGSDQDTMVELTDLTILTLNVKGLNIPEKRFQVLDSLHKHRVHIALLQETHFKCSQIPKMTGYRFPLVYHATLANAKGLAPHLRLEITDMVADPEARYIFIRGKLGSTPITIANIYSSNTKQLTFFLADRLKTFLLRQRHANCRRILYIEGTNPD